MNQPPTNPPATDLRGGSGGRGVLHVCTQHRAAPTRKLSAVPAVESHVPVPGFLESQKLPVVLTCHRQPTAGATSPQLGGQGAPALMWEPQEPHRRWS